MDNVSTLTRQEDSFVETLQKSKVTGWREWLALPDISIPSIEAKVDTGSKLSTLYTSFVENYRRDGELWVRFGVNPLPGREDIRLVCQAPVKNTRTVTVSDNHEETFFVIESLVQIGGHQCKAEIVLKTHGTMKFMMHLGRNALQDLNLIVAPQCSCLFGDDLESYYD